MRATRRTMLLSGLATPLLARRGLAQSRPTLRVQCIGGLIEKTIREDVIPNFEKEHGTDVQLIVEDDVTILPKLEVARSRAPYDICMMDNDKAILGAEAGLWAPDQAAKLKNIGAIYPSCKPPQTANYGTILFEYALGLQHRQVQDGADLLEGYLDARHGRRRCRIRAKAMGSPSSILPPC